MGDLVDQINQRIEVFKPGGDNEKLLARAVNEIKSLRLQLWETERRLEWVWSNLGYESEYDPKQDVPWAG